MPHAPEIAVALSGLPTGRGRPWGSSTHEGCAFVRELRVRGVALDGARPDCRAKDLGRSARRDLAAMIRRAELELAGIDLWIPSEHYADAQRSARALEAALAGAVLAAELARLVGGRSRPVVSVTLPAALGEHDRAALAHGAERHGAIVADHTPDAASMDAGTGVGVDPAACLLAGTTPQACLHRAGPALASLRLSDLNAAGRCAVASEGARLDLPAYAASAVGTGLRWITADTRGVNDASRAVQAAIDGWGAATRLPDGRRV